MANEAQREPTMEEILASIRKIISDDDTSAQQNRKGMPPARTAPPVPAVNDDEFVSLMADDDGADPDVFEAESVFKSDRPDQSRLPDPASFEEILSAAKESVAPPPVQPVAAKAPPQPPQPPAPPKAVAPTPPPPAARAPEPPPAPKPVPPAPHKVETAMTASPRYQQTILTDEHTADIAAGSLGKLISKMDVSSQNTIEGLVREMLKPMIKDWLDTNLPRIVEEKVEAEVQRIARMAR